MARYDRIAPIPLPARDAAFPGWLVLRDLVGGERDPELARRARLRFLALRPLRRILSVGREGVGAASFERQLDGVREELGVLPSRDPERLRISNYLRRIDGRVPSELVTAAADLGEMAEQAGHVSAAEEYYRTSAELGEHFALPALAAPALRRLGTLCSRMGRMEEAARHLSTAARTAQRGGADVEWVRATAAGALLLAADGGSEADAALEELYRRTRDMADPAVRSLASIALADAAILRGDFETALERAWEALETTPAGRLGAEAMARAAGAFLAADMPLDAIRCYDMILQEGATGDQALIVQAARAEALAAAGRIEDLGRARDELLRAVALAPPPRTATQLHASLARACVAAGWVDAAREHVRNGFCAARGGACADLVPGLDAALSALEEGVGPAGHALRPAGPRAHVIAASIGTRDTSLP